MVFRILGSRDDPNSGHLIFVELNDGRLPWTVDVVKKSHRSFLIGLEEEEV